MNFQHEDLQLGDHGPFWAKDFVSHYSNYMHGVGFGEIRWKELVDSKKCRIQLVGQGLYFKGTLEKEESLSYKISKKRIIWIGEEAGTFLEGEKWRFFFRFDFFFGKKKEDFAIWKSNWVLQKWVFWKFIQEVFRIQSKNFKKNKSKPIREFGRGRIWENLKELHWSPRKFWGDSYWKTGLLLGFSFDFFSNHKLVWIFWPQKRLKKRWAESARKGEK